MTPRARLRAGGALALLLGLVVTGCAQTGPASPSTPGAQTPATDPPSLADTRWLAADIGGTAVADGTAVTAAFGVDGSLTGSGGCNRYTTTYTTSGTTIEIDEAIAITLMACDQAVMDQESAFIAALTGARTFALTGDQLTLSDEAGAALVSFDVQSQQLEGSWLVTGYHDGGSAVVSPVAGTEPSFDFADGTVSGTAGCNRLNGSYEVDGNSISVGPFMSTRMACAEPEGVMEQEAALSAALESAATFTIEGDGLVLHREDGAMAATLTRG